MIFDIGFSIWYFILDSVNDDDFLLLCCVFVISVVY